MTSRGPFVIPGDDRDVHVGKITSKGGLVMRVIMATSDKIHRDARESRKGRLATGNRRGNDLASRGRRKCHGTCASEYLAARE